MKRCSYVNRFGVHLTGEFVTNFLFYKTLTHFFLLVVLFFFSSYFSRSGFFAAASFMSFQQSKFNFGRSPFKFAPSDIEFRTFNQAGYLSETDKMVLPKQIRLLAMHSYSQNEDSCTLCFDSSANTELLPCGHKGFCDTCSMQCESCPLCRCTIEERRNINHQIST